MPRVALSLAVVAILASCSLPRGAPVQSKIINASTAEGADFSVIHVNRDSVSQLKSWPKPLGVQGVASAGWPSGGAGSGGGAAVIAPGDLIELTVWESGESPLLAPPTAKSVDLKAAQVSANGSIFVPFIGEVRLRGLTPEQARETIQKQMEGSLDAPQVQINVTPGRQNTVDLIGGVPRAGSYPLQDRGVSVLSLLSQGGGIAPGLRNPQVRLMRGGKVYEIAAETLMANPAKDTLLRGGDKVVVEEDRRYFIALGAASQQKQVHFPQEQLNALDAMALLGGVAASRADPKGILVMRDYAAKALRSDGSGPDQTKMVFALDLTTADGLFSARQFQIAPGDLVLVTESPVNSVRTIFGLIGQAIGVANAAANATD